MSRPNHFAIPADSPERAIGFYERVFGWRFSLAWEYDTPQGREKYWHIATGAGSTRGIDGGLTRREYPGQPIGLGVEVTSVDSCIEAVEQSGGKAIVRKVAIPGVAWFALCQDTEGNSFSIFEPDPTAA